MIVTTLLVSQSLWGDNLRDSDERDSDERDMQKMSAQHNNATSGLTLYEKECGSCHMAYPPAALPQRSWRKIMASLDNHFGDNAELDAQTHNAIAEYLDNPGVTSKRVKKLRKGVKKSQTPMRITELPYFKREHNEIPSRVIKNNPKVKSLSQCDSCHKDASSGRFSERKIDIPGYGRWDD